MTNLLAYKGKAFGLSLLAWISLGSGASAAANPQLADEQIVKLGNGGEPRELDPSIATGHPEMNILNNLFEGLTALDPVTLEPIPGVAESWDVKSNGLVYVFNLRKNAKWSDGKPLTAQDFVAAWTRTLAPATASQYAYQLHYLKNGKAFNQGKIKDASKLGVKALGPHVLEVTLEQPTPYFLQLTSFAVLFPTPAHTIKKFPDQEWTREGKMVSNGPFKLAEWRINKHIKVVTNPNYWDKDRVKLEAAYFIPIEDSDTEEKSFFAGEIHKTETVPNIKIPAYLKAKQKNPSKPHPYKSVPALATYYYRFNVTKKPFNDPRVRRALALAIDRKLIVDKIKRGGEKPATGFTPPNLQGYNFPSSMPVTVTKESIAEAKSLLKQAGYSDPKTFPKVEILYNTDDNHKKVALAIQQMWKKNLGISVGIINQEWKVYLNTQKSLGYSISRSAWIRDYVDPNTFLNMFVTDGGQNQTGWSNKKYDQLIQQASLTGDQQQRYKYFLEAESILMEELPIMPIYFYTYNQLVSPKLKRVADDGSLEEYKINILDLHFLKYAALAK